jgi:hypothetical protein
MRTLLAAALLAAATSPAFAGPVYYVDLINTSPSNIVAFDVAPAGASRFHSVLPGNATLQGGSTAATVAIRKGEDGCLRDLRIRFADGHVLMQRDFDVCKFGG